MEAAGIGSEQTTPLFRAALGKTNSLSARGISRTDALRMIKRRARAAGLPVSTCCHTFRASGITSYLDGPQVEARA